MKNHKANMSRLITEYGISQAALAAKMNMLPGTFSNKFRINHSTQFTAEEIAELRELLLAMAQDIQNTLSESMYYAGTKINIKKL